MKNKIFSKRITLKPIEEEDLPLIVLWSNTEETYGKYLTTERFSLAECLKKFKHQFFWNDKNKTYLIDLKTEKKTIGLIKYWINPDKKNIAVIALKISYPDYRNHGYGTEAQKTLIKNLFLTDEFNYIDMYTDIDNIAEQKCLKKLGFDFVETMEYDDYNTKRLGNLYRLPKDKFSTLPIYIYAYE